MSNSIGISVGFRKSRARDASKPGVVYLRLSGQKCDGSKGAVSFNTDIKGVDEGIIDQNKTKIAALIRMVYEEIERLDREGKAITIDTVAEQARARFTANEPVNTDDDSAMRTDLVSVAGQFRDCFSFTSIKQAMLPEVVDLLSYTAMKSIQCRQENRICTSRSYGNLQKELKEFCKAEAIPWEKVNAGLVRDFATWLTGQGYKASTRAYYLGMLRTILFQAREDGYCQATSEWFRPVRTEAKSNPTGKTEKKLDVEVVRKIAELDLSGREELAMVRDMFLFAFYCRGMELVDIAHLTKANLQGQTLVYNRRLTGKEIRVPIDREALNIISRYDNGRKYLFPLLDTGRSALFTTRRNIVVMRIKEIGTMVDCPDLTFVRNIDAWKSFVSEIRISDGLRYYQSGA